MIFLALVLGMLFGAFLMFCWYEHIDDIRWWREHHDCLDGKKRRVS